MKIDTQPPYVLINPAIVKSAPAFCPKLMLSTPQRITRAVSVQITIVSINTSKTPYRPCLTGSSVSADACEIDPVPRPASFENIPLETPFFMQRNIDPTTPPVAADGLNAPSNIIWNTCGIVLKFITTTPNPSRIYIPAIKGTSFSVTAPILLIPPSKIIKIRIVIIIPIIKLTVLIDPAETTLKFRSAVSIAVVIVLTCVALPVPNTVRTPRQAYA